MNEIQLLYRSDLPLIRKTDSSQKKLTCLELYGNALNSS
jgi:hypothetical protein